LSPSGVSPSGEAQLRRSQAEEFLAAEPPGYYWSACRKCVAFPLGDGQHNPERVKHATDLVGGKAASEGVFTSETTA